MIKFNIHSIESAPQDAKPILEQLKQQVGFIPNLAATMAESPSLLEAFTTLRMIYGRGSFTPLEREALALAISFENDCTYCMAAHSTFAKMNGVSEDDLKALRSGEAPADPRLRAISTLARGIVRTKGDLSEQEIGAFLAAGFTQAQLLEVLVGISMTAIANYAHNIAKTSIDEAFQSQAWAASA